MKPVDALYEQLKVMRWYELASEEGIQPRSTPHTSYEMYHKAIEVVHDDKVTFHATTELNRINGTHPELRRGEGTSQQYLTALLHDEAAALNESETFFVTADMGRIVDAAARTLPFEALRQTDLPCPNGFVYFEQPLHDEDESLRATNRRWHWPIRAVRWGPTRLQDRTRPGIEIAVYADGPNDHYDTTGKGTFNKWEMGDITDDFVKGKPHPSAKEVVAGSLVTTVPKHRLWLEDYDGWAFDLDWFHAEPDNTEDRYPEHDVAQQGGVTGSVVWQRKVLLSFFRLCFQKIAVIHRETSRQGARQALRGGLRTPEPGTIQIVKLRREARPPSTGNSTVDWSHQWIVKGHWRLQWYASLGRHQSIYIHDFVKGPTDKPLVIKDRIYSLER